MVANWTQEREVYFEVVGAFLGPCQNFNWSWIDEANLAPSIRKYMTVASKNKGLRSKSKSAFSLSIFINNVFNYWSTHAIMNLEFLFSRIISNPRSWAVNFCIFSTVTKAFRMTLTKCAANFLFNSNYWSDFYIIFMIRIYYLYPAKLSWIWIVHMHGWF